MTLQYLTKLFTDMIATNGIQEAKMTNNHVLRQQIKLAYEQGAGIFRLAPTWVPRSFLMPGRRLKLAPQDIYALGAHRGGIDERWFSSTTLADNGPGTEADEGLSYVVYQNQRAFTLKDAIEEDGALLIGQEMMTVYGGWPVYSKFFDNLGPIPFHLHQMEADAKRVGRQSKPEAYYFPPQLNAVENRFPHTYFGLEPGTTREDIRHCLERWDGGDNHILDYAKAFRLRPGTGWNVPAGILHAPGSLVTFEPQWASDVFAMYQSMVEERPVGWELLVKDVPLKHHHDLDYLLDLIDWQANLNPEFRQSHYIEPLLVDGGAEAGYEDKWVVYGRFQNRQLFSAKELTVQPGVAMTLKDPGAFGMILLQGYGRISSGRNPGHPLQTPAMIRYGELTHDEYFVTARAALEGVTIENLGSEPIVILRYFGPDTHEDLPDLKHDTAQNLALIPS